MTNNDLFYVCSLIEFIARKTQNRRKVIVESLGIEGIKKQFHDAPMNHCLPFEQICEELTDYYHIPTGDFDTISKCKYPVPSFQDIGKLYAIIIQNCANGNSYTEELIKVFSSFISDEISNFNTDLYYQNPSYIEHSYKTGYLLE